MYQLRKAISTPMMKKQLTSNNVNAMDTAAVARENLLQTVLGKVRHLPVREEKG